MKIPKSNSLVVSVPKERNYHIDEGCYRARIQKFIRVTHQKSMSQGENLRIVFEVTVPGKDKCLNLAKAEFKLDLNQGSELRNVITRLIGKEAMSALSGSSFDFDQLKGMEVEVEIRHIITDKSENYDYPFVKVSDIQKPGTMGLPEPEPQPELVEEDDDSKEVSCY